MPDVSAQLSDVASKLQDVHDLVPDAAVDFKPHLAAVVDHLSRVAADPTATTSSTLKTILTVTLSFVNMAITLVPLIAPFIPNFPTAEVLTGLQDVAVLLQQIISILPS